MVTIIRIVQRIFALFLHPYESNTTIKVCKNHGYLIRVMSLCPDSGTKVIQALKFSRVTSNVRILIRRTKHELIIKLIAHE